MSDVSICNLALQKLGAQRIVSLSDENKNARAVNACYEHERDLELRTHLWSFAKKRIALAPSSVAPAFDFSYAFPLPTDYIAWIPDPTISLDWSIESHEGALSILTNDGSVIYLRYIAKIEDTEQFDPLFQEALACRIAWQCCEEITQSNSKQAKITDDYTQAIRLAKRRNAFEVVPQEPVEDSWIWGRM